MRPDPTDERAAVAAANAAFYEAFERRDLDAMGHVWEHSGRVRCVHPGWAPLVGWPTVRRSWELLFDGPQQLQFIVTDEHVEVVGGMAWVTCNENLLDGASTSTVATTHVFARHHDRWRLVVHHGSPVVQRPTPRD